MGDSGYCCVREGKYKLFLSDLLLRGYEVEGGKA